jgi:F420H(2)-dependent quinone reductase
MIGRRMQTVIVRGHAWVYRGTGGRIGRRLLGMEQVLLTTTGRSTGAPRTTPLSAFPLDPGKGTPGGGIVLVASDGGSPRHPQWYRNLCVQPEVVVQRGARAFAMRARTATPAERERLWPHIVAVYGGYAHYQARTEREIPLVICEPR